jgi:hypothetical protein
MVYLNHTQRLRLVVACATLLVWSSPQPAQAQPHAPALYLQYDAPSECPSRSAVEGAALRLAGQAPRVPIEARVFIEKDAEVYRAHVRTHAGAGQRTLEDTSCTSVAEAIEVLLALAIDPDAPVGATATGSNPSPAAPAGTPSVPLAPNNPQPQPSSNAAAHSGAWSSPQEVSPRPEPRRGPLVLVSALIGIEDGALPHVAEVGTISLAVPISSRLKLAASGRIWQGSSQTLPGATAGGAFSLWTLASSACVVTTRGAPMTSVCVGWEAGRLSGTSFGVRSNGGGGSLWLAPLARFEASLPASSLVSLVVDAELSVPLVRRGFYLEEVGSALSSQIHRPSALSKRLGFGLILNF